MIVPYRNGYGKQLGTREFRNGMTKISTGSGQRKAPNLLQVGA